MEQILEAMKGFVEFVKPVLIVICSAVLSIVAPVQESIYLLMAGALLNWFTGFRKDEIVNKAKFSLKKSWNAISQLLLYFALVLFVRFTFATFNDFNAADISTKWISYIVIYFYTLNVVKNATLIWPNDRAFKLMYEVLSTKVLSDLRAYLMIKRDGKE